MELREGEREEKKKKMEELGIKRGRKKNKKMEGLEEGEWKKKKKKMMKKEELKEKEGEEEQKQSIAYFTVLMTSLVKRFDAAACSTSQTVRSLEKYSMH